MPSDGAPPGPGSGRPSEAELSELSADPGLCASCRHLRLLRSTRSVFVRCGLAAVDERFPRYPRLPVVRCAGFEKCPPEGPRPQAP